MYAQINYSQKLGTGPYTIAEAGCFLTAFCNLLARFGSPIDPPSLNNYFIQHGKYGDVDGDHTLDDLAYGTVTTYDGQITTVGINNSAGGVWPDSNDAIVKFHYQSKSKPLLANGKPNMINHFCLVADHTARTIMDSWDGTIKKSPYGNPVAWAKYERHVPQVVSPPAPADKPAYSIETIPQRSVQLKLDTKLWDLNQRTWPGLVNSPIRAAAKGDIFTTSAIAHHVLGGSYYMQDAATAQGFNVVDCQVYTPPAPSKPPSAPISAPSSETYDVIREIPGYVTSNQAINNDAAGRRTTIAPGTYFVFNKRLPAINVTQAPGKPGSWINPADNVEAPPEPPALDVAIVEPEPVVVPEPEVPPTPVVADYQSTYKPFGDGNGMVSPVKYVAMRDYSVADVAGENNPVPLHMYDIILIAGTFTNNGVNLARPEAAAKVNKWYALPFSDDNGAIIRPYTEVFNGQTSVQERQALHTLKTSDYLALGREEISKIAGTIENAWDIIVHKNKKANKK